MREGTMITGIIATMVVVVAIFALFQFGKQRKLREKYPGYPEGYWKNKGMGIGIALGAGIGIAMDSIPIGVGIGVAIGAAIGSRLEKQHEDDIRPMVDEEKALQRQSLMLSIGTFLVGVVVFVITYFVTR